MRSEGRGDVGLVWGRGGEGVSSHSAEVRSSRRGGSQSGLGRRDDRFRERELRRRSRQGEILLLFLLVLAEVQSAERRRPRQNRKHHIRLVFIHHAVFALGFPPLLPPSRLLFSRRLGPTRGLVLVLLVVTIVVPGLGGSIALIFHVEPDESTPERGGGILDVDDGGREVLDPGG